MANKAPTNANDLVQATILKKCDRGNHHPEDSKRCAARDAGDQAGACQHTCEPDETENCRHKWTVRYSAHSVQREKSFATFVEAQVFQLDISTKKVTQGSLFTDPNAGGARFGDMRKEYMSRLDVSDDSRDGYECNYRGSGAAKMLDNLPVATVAKMDAEVEDLLNGPNLTKSRDYRVNVLRMVRGTLDRAVRRQVIPGHLFADVELKTYRPTAEQYAERNAAWVFVTDAQAAAMADGAKEVTTDRIGRTWRRTRKGAGVAAWLMRVCGARIGEALGAEKSDFTELEDGTRVWQLRWQAADDGNSLVALKHRPAGEGRDIPVPDFLWEKIQALPDGPVCPGPKTKYMSYATARGRLTAAAKAAGVAPGWHAHNLRHQFASEEAAGGANIADLAETLGHQSPEITFRRYVRSMPGRTVRMAARMNDRWPAAKGSGEDHQDDSAAPLSLAA